MNFHVFLLARWEKSKNIPWVKRSCVDDICMDFAADVAANPATVPTEDGKLFDYLQRRVGWVDLPNQITGRFYVEWEKLRDEWETVYDDKGKEVLPNGWKRLPDGTLLALEQHTVFTGSALDWLWQQYLRVRP
jgi:hypothetical protein